jgi:hypothetical protein
MMWPAKLSVYSLLCAAAAAMAVPRGSSDGPQLYKLRISA